MSQAPAFGKRAAAARSVKAFACPSCGGSIELRAVGISVTAVCRHCGTVVDAADPDVRILQAAREAASQPAIAVGSRGELYGHTWEVIGYVRKSVINTFYSWDEYLLFNPWQGFRFLSNVNGHWTWFKRINEGVQGIGRRNELHFRGQSYKVFNKDRVVVDAVYGEFYWRVKVGDETWCADYIAPPHMLSSEEREDEVNLSWGIYVPRNDLARAFPEARLPHPSGIGACQPPPFANRLTGIVATGIVAAVVAAAVHVIAALSLPNELMLSVANQPMMSQPAAGVSYTTQTLPGTPYPSVVTPSWDSPAAGWDQNGRTMTTPAFVLPEPSNLRVDTWTALDNGWAEFDLTLVEEASGKTYPLRQVNEYYHGYEGGESWSEGRNRSGSLLQRLPAGTYHLVIDGASDSLAKTGALPYTLEVRRGVTDFSNLIAALVLIAIFPVYALFRRQMFEQSRWSNSDYNPYESSDD